MLGWLKRLVGGGGSPAPPASAGDARPAPPAGDRPSARDDAAGLLAAIRDGSFDRVYQLVSDDPDLVDRAIEGATPLHHAAHAGALDIVQLLVERDADLAARDRKRKLAPIGWANEAGHTPVVRFLFAAGSSADLREAAAFGLTQRVRDAIDEAPEAIDAADGYGTALHHAVRWGHPEAVEALLARGADATARSASGRTPLEIAHEQIEDPSRGTPLLVASRAAERAAGWRRCEELLRVHLAGD